MRQTNSLCIHKRILSVILALAVLLLALPAWSLTADSAEIVPLAAAAEFAGGSGTENDPYLIATAEQMKKLADDVNGGEKYKDIYFKLTADIDLNGSEDNPWTPIGKNSYRFYGIFDGGGHEISGLYINSTYNYQGLFGYVDSGGTIENLGVDGSVTGNHYVGGVVGYIYDGTVQNCYNTGSVRGNGDGSGNGGAGGVVGTISGSAVQNCYNIGTVNGARNVGGVVGHSDNSSNVQNCYNTGDVNGATNVGGVAGAGFNGSIMKNCYNTGDVSGSTSVGGVVGAINHSGTTVQNCYNTGDVNKTATNVGGVVGQVYNTECKVENCFFLQNSTTNNGLSGVGTGTSTGTGARSRTDFTALADALNTDNEEVWGYHTTFLKSHPILIANPEVSGTGTSDDPYLFRTPEGLEDMRDYINGTGNFSGNAHTGAGEFFGLANCIDLNGNESNQWTPIGYQDRDFNLQFSGTFDGGGHLISGLYINNNSANREYYGLFGYVVGGTIKNLGVNGSVTGNRYIGGIVGSGNNCTIENCYNIGNIKGYNYIGGICGSIDPRSDAKFINCYNAGSVEAFDDFAGGITGFGYRCTIRNCYNIGSVTSEYGGAGGIAGSSQGGRTIEYCYNGKAGIVKGGSAGGIVGYSGLIENCYNAGTVEGIDDSYSVGGIAGNMATITNCYNIGKITGTAENAGGIAGASSDVTNCYNLGSINVTADNVGGIVGILSYYDSVENCYNFGTIDVTGDNVGGIAGDFYEEHSLIENCYYLEGDYFGIGSTEEDTIGQAEAKDAAQFKSGEVAWLLQDGQDEQVWYQNTDTENYPTFEGTADTIVYRVAFISGIEENKYPFEAHYNNSPFTVSAPPADDPEREGYEFVRWTTDKTQTGENYEFTSVTVDNENVDIYAVWRETFGADDEATPITITISQGETSDEYDLDELLAYFSGETAVAENFTYIPEYNEKDGLTVTINGSKLTVTAADNAKPGKRELTVTASEKSPQLSTIALLADYGTEDVELTVTVYVMGHQDAPDADSIEVKKSHNSITVTSPDNSDGEFEFSIDGGDTWQPGNEFTGLDAGETYEISVRYKETDELDASDSATKDVTTAENANGKTTLKPGETVEGTGKGEDVTNKNGKVTITDSSGTKTTVTLPDGMTDVEIDEDGNVIIPGGSTVTAQNGTEFTAEDDAIVGADGSVTFPGTDGGDIGFGNTEIEVPGNKPVTPNTDGTLTIPDGTSVTPPSGKPVITVENANDEATVDKNGKVKFPGGGTAKVVETEVTLPDDGGALEPVGDGFVKVPKGSKVKNSDGETTLADDGILDENGKLFEGAVRIGNVLFIPPENETVTDNNGTVTVPAGTTVIPDDKTDYTVTSEGGEVNSTDGSVTLPEGGSIKLGSAAVTAPEGGGTFTPNTDGETVTVPDGSSVTPPSGAPEIKIVDANDKATVDKSGNVTLPEGGEAKIGDTAVTVPEGGTLTPNSDKTVTVPEDTVVKGDPEITLPDGGIIDSDGNIILPEGGDVGIGDTTVNVPEGGTVTPNDNGTVTVPDDSVVTPPGGTPEITIVDANDEATVDKDGNVTFPDGGDAKIGSSTVEIPEGGTLEPNGEGGVILPEGSTVTDKDGKTTELPNGGVMDKDGNIISDEAPKTDNSFKIGDTTVTLPEGGKAEVNADGTVTVPDGSVVTPPGGAPEIEITDGKDKAVVDRDGNVTFPDGGEAKIGSSTVEIPEGGTLTPDGEGGVILPEGSKVTDKDGKITELPNGGVMDKDGNIKPNGSDDTPNTDNSFKIGDTVVTLPEGGEAETNEDGSVTVPDGSKVKFPDGTTMELPDGGTVSADGKSVDIPEGKSGSIKTGDTKINVPNGGTVKSEGSGTVTVPDGSAVTPPSGSPEIVITDADNKATVDKNGNITFPNGGSIKIGDTTITVTEGGTVKPLEDGTVLLPEGAAVTKNDGTSSIVPAGGAVYDPATGELKDNSSGNGSGDNSGDGSGDNSGNNSGNMTPPPVGNTTDPSADGNNDTSGGTSDPSTDDNNNPSGDTSKPSTGDSTDTSGGVSADKVNIRTVSGENAPEVTIDEESLNKLKEEVIAEHLTPEERAAVQNGATIGVILSVEIVKGDLPAADKQTVEALLSNSEHTVGIHLNIELIKLINGQQVGKITEINTPIRVTVGIPEELRSANRVFAVIRVHNGQAEMLNDTDNDPDTITIVTDKFSTYSIVYKNAEAPNSDNPNTGTTMPIAVIALASAVIVAAVTVRKRKMI